MDMQEHNKLKQKNVISQFKVSLNTFKKPVIIPKPLLAVVPTQPVSNVQKRCDPPVTEPNN